MVGDTGFESPADAVKQWAKAHAIQCTVKYATDEAEKWGPMAKQLYQILATQLIEFIEHTGMPEAGAQTALILLCRSFCNSTGVKIGVFAENFLMGLDEAKAHSGTSEAN